MFLSAGDVDVAEVAAVGYWIQERVTRLGHGMRTVQAEGLAGSLTFFSLGSFGSLGAFGSFAALGSFGAFTASVSVLAFGILLRDGRKG